MRRPFHQRVKRSGVVVATDAGTTAPVRFTGDPSSALLPRCGGVGLQRRRVGTAIALLGATSLIGACAGTTSSDVTAVGVQDPVSTNSAPSTTSSGGTDAASIDLDPLKPCLDTLSVEEKAGQVLWVMTATPANVADSAKAGKIGGVGALEDQGGDIAGQITAVTADTSVPMTVASDEEGGTVQRLDKVIEPLPSARDTTGTLSTAQTKAMWTKVLPRRWRGLGFTANFAPVLDVGFGVALKSRSYALDPQVVVDFALAAADGMTEGGIKPIAKALSGIGYATADPHGELVRVSSLNELEAAGVSSVPSSHRRRHSRHR